MEPTDRRLQPNAMSGDTPRSRCAYYRSVCQLPAVLEPPTGRIFFTTGRVWAISMPAAMGQAVKQHLDRRHGGGGPIISHPRRHTWTMLTRADTPPNAVRDEAMLQHYGIRVLRGGQRIALPSPADRGTQFRGWILPARSTFCPSGLVVLASARIVLGARVTHR
ncbi:DNA-directed RNA polymerase subunit beta [Nocardia asteroides]|uniref:DNA-directed RNA polymerase subunit beta n=1 Tax=Nocardia asteroides TaxID=1824 RepID=UPI001E46261A|nr:DNA-directed RNA polymerase subunit beta [Nocardia asteroides]UGT62868.1 DNA-directed RNA polymerase subunit beta [Nocardia asteroides]